MKVAWVTHHVGGGDPAQGWLPGEHRGGGEITDADWRAAAPAGVEVTVVSPERWREAVDADRVVVTGTDLLSDEAMCVLAASSPSVALHHRQARSAARQRLLNAADPLIVHTPGHEAVERQWCSPGRVVHVLSPMRADEFSAPVNDWDVCLWASRDHPLKGRPVAESYARRHGWQFVPIIGRPRADVLEAMGRARRFIHLPLEFESEGRGVIEAVLSGCDVVANGNVGVTSCGRWRDPGWLAEATFDAGARFWEAVLS